MEYITLTAPYLIVFYFAVLLFIRPTKSAWLYSLLGGLIMGAINLLGDLIAYFAHWWYYTFKPISFQGGMPAYLSPFVHALDWTQTHWHLSLPFYMTPILIFGSLAFLFVWRFWQGRLRWISYVFLIGSPLFCIVRDITGGVENTSFQIWQNTPAATIATIVMWIVAFAAGFFVFWRLAPARVETHDEGLNTNSSSVLNHSQSQVK